MPQNSTKKPLKPQTSNYTKRQLEAFEEINDKGAVRPDAVVTTPVDGLKVKRPAMFMADPPVVGDIEFQLMVRELQKRIPHGDVSKIVKGHTGPSMSAHMQSGMPAESMGHSNLLGIYGLKDKSIGIRPGMEKDMTRDTLVHELSHSRGFGEEEAERLGSEFNPPAELMDAESGRKLEELIKRYKVPANVVNGKK